MAAGAISFTSGFIGRERELAELLSGLADVIAGHGHFFLLNGEPGIGKTRLADEFGRMAVMQGVRVVWGPCSLSAPSTFAEAYGPWSGESWRTSGCEHWAEGHHRRQRRF